MTAEAKKAYMRAYRERNKERLAEQNKASCLARYYRDHEANKAKKRADYRKRNDLMRERDAARRAADPEKHRQRSADYARRNKEKVAAQQKAWRERNKQQQREYKRRQYLANAEAFKARAVAFAKANPGYRAAIARKRQAVKKACPVGDVKAVAAFYRMVRTAAVLRCHWCGRDIPKGNERTVDHVTPIALGGGHTIDNLVPACRSCNCSKNKRPPADFTPHHRTAGIEVS